MRWLLLLLLVGCAPVKPFPVGELADRRIIYGEELVGNNTSGESKVFNHELNFPAGSIVGIKAQRLVGVGEAKVNVLFAYYDIDLS